MKKICFILSICFLACFSSSAQVKRSDAPLDTAGIYGDRSDTLSTAVATGTGSGGVLSKYKDLRTEVITAAGLCKMACCNLAESFENSASVTVGYSDAVTGARQIKLLGLSGAYTQMLDENRPVMRGLAAPFGLSYVPGQWLSSIQIAKGAPSVINGVESITGQINMEHRKPTDEVPFFANASFMSDLKADLNLASSLQLDKEGKWSTTILAHVCGNFKAFDINGDGFYDEPKNLGVNLANRWLYFDPNGTQVRFGFRFLRDSRQGGQTVADGWTSDITNQSFNAYLKVGVPLNDDNTQNIAFVGDFNDYSAVNKMGYRPLEDGALSGPYTGYDGIQLSGFGNLLYQNQMWEQHHFTVGLSAMYDNYNEMLSRNVFAQQWKTSNPVTNLLDLGIFGEYTFHLDERLSVIAGLRGDWYNQDGKFRVSPRVTVKYAPVDEFVIRLNGGRGLRYACPVSDNIGTLSTGKRFFSDGNFVDGSMTNPLFASHPLEDAWVAGGNITFYLPFGVGENNTYLSVDYFRTQFTNQLVVDYDHFTDVIDFYMSKGQSYTNTYQIDFNVEPIKRFNITATFRYTDAKVSYADRGLQERPMVSRYKGVLNLQYATNLNKWIFDFTASVNGPCRLYDFMNGGQAGYSPVYPLLYAQVTHRMKGWDIYIGGENLTNFKQKSPIISADNPASSKFDASCIWGPLMGIKGYIGVRVTLWKKG